MVSLGHVGYFGKYEVLGLKWSMCKQHLASHGNFTLIQAASGFGGGGMWWWHVRSTVGTLLQSVSSKKDL